MKPLRFPGGSIGHLAVHGTVNDLAVQGAQPAWLSAAFVIEEGFPIDELREIVADMADAAGAAGVQIVTGDTKVVGRGAADGLFITTAGVGVIPPAGARPRDACRPATACSCRARSPITGWRSCSRAATSRSRPTSAPTPRRSAISSARCSPAAPNTRWMRDPTRGGVGTVCNELARDTGLAVVLDEAALPMLPR